LTLTKLEEEELKDLNHDGDADTNAAINNDTWTSNFVDFASLGNRSISNGDRLDLDNPEGVGQGRRGGA